ncbi:P-loop containing nucleoside triphosphate hydrolase protein [Pisolithus marmoratus]|nr:P-loop containing nucleoside triphosphate hydrolase protein [Pisolithus marmoratus]
MSSPSTLRARSLVPTSAIKPDDVVILVMGKTGSGMSNFINKLTGMPPEDGAERLSSCTKEVYAYKCDHNGQRFIFLDTPGFNNQTMPQSEVFRAIARWLKKTYRRSIKLTGVIYTQSITDNGSSATDVQSSHLLGRLCGNEAFDRIRLVMTMCDEVEASEADKVEGALQRTQWQSLIQDGARPERFDNTMENGWEIVRRLGNRKKTLFLQKELVDMRKALEDTTAGKLLGLKKTATIRGRLKQWFDCSS